ncbi:MAG: RHS repeat domain-containing protein [Armatimonadota bacterium]
MLRGQSVGLGASHSTAGFPAVIQEDGIYYYREPGGSLVARQDTAMHYYHFDELGSTRLLTDGSGAISDKYSYDAWGKLLWHDGTTNQPYQYVGKYGYYAHWQEPGFGLMQLGVRFYDTEVGRFTQRDALADILSTYRYCDGNSLRYIDPWGLKEKDPGMKHLEDGIKKIIAKIYDEICKTGGDASFLVKVIEQMKKLAQTNENAAKIMRACEPFFHDVIEAKNSRQIPEGMDVTCISCFGAFSDKAGNAVSHAIVYNQCTKFTKGKGKCGCSSGR